MPIFTSKDKNKNRSVNFTFIVGLPHYCRGDSVNVTIDLQTGMLVTRPRAFYKRPEISLPLSRITEAVHISESEIVEKNKSVVGRAAIGSLFGPTAAIIGGLSAVNGKTEVETKEYIVIKYTNAANDAPIVLRVVGASIGWRQFLQELQPDQGEPADSITL